MQRRSRKWANMTSLWRLTDYGMASRKKRFRRPKAKSLFNNSRCSPNEELWLSAGLQRLTLVRPRMAWWRVQGPRWTWNPSSFTTRSTTIQTRLKSKFNHLKIESNATGQFCHGLDDPSCTQSLLTSMAEWVWKRLCIRPQPRRLWKLRRHLMECQYSELA